MTANIIVNIAHVKR